jgi:dihydroorotate dehydrogenase
MIWKLLRKLLFRLPPETTHDLAKIFMRIVVKLSFGGRTFPLTLPNSPKNCLGVMNPVGLAAGFDKNCDILELLPHFGFGYAEIGTVTPKPQGGNDRPRLFREPKDEALFNRMGFNNLGAGVISARLRKIKPQLPKNFKVGVNLGKNKETTDENAASDYAKVASAFLDTADYFVINVSSPNTPGLRALQTPEALTKIVLAVQSETKKSVSSTLNNAKHIPIFVKLAPEVRGEPLKIIIQALEALKIDGFVLTNTRGGVIISGAKEYSGGFSGQILSTESMECLQEVRPLTRLPIISVGGIATPEQARARFAAGADLIQIYTGWIYEGPFSIRKIIRHILPTR